MQDELTELRATATSPDKAVTVVAGPGGAVLDVTFTEDALRQSPAALSAAVMATLGQAVAAAARQQAAIVEEHMGGDMNLVDQVLETQAAVFGTSVEEMREKLAEETAAPEARVGGLLRAVLRPARGEPEQPAPPASPPAGSAGDSYLRKLFDQEDDEHAGRRQGNRAESVSRRRMNSATPATRVPWRNERESDF